MVNFLCTFRHFVHAKQFFSSILHTSHYANVRFCCICTSHFVWMNKSCSTFPAAKAIKLVSHRHAVRMQRFSLPGMTAIVRMD